MTIDASRQKPKAISRRAIVAGAAALAAAMPASGRPMAKASPGLTGDAELARLYRARIEAEQASLAAEDAVDLIAFGRDAPADPDRVARLDVARATRDDVESRLDVITRRMVETPAASIAGVLFKLALAYECEDDLRELAAADAGTRPAMSVFAASALIDLMRMVRAAGGETPDPVWYLGADEHGLLEALINVDRNGARRILARLEERESAARARYATEPGRLNPAAVIGSSRA